MYEAVILAGGFGTRLRGIVPDLPKPMAPIAGRPFLEFLLDNLASKGFSRVVLSLGYMAEKIVGYFGESYAGLELIYVVEDKPLGTGGALRLALSECKKDHIFVFNGDTFLDLNVVAIEANWIRNRSPIIVGVAVENTYRYGRLIYKNGKVSGFQEKGIAGPGIINAGCYVFKRDQLDAFEIGGHFSLETDYLIDAVRASSFKLFETKGRFIDIGIPEDYESAQTMLIDYYA